MGLRIGGAGGEEPVEQLGRRMAQRVRRRAERRERRRLLAGDGRLEHVGPARERVRRQRVAGGALQVDDLVGVQRGDAGRLRGELAAAHDARDEREAMDRRPARARVDGRLEARPRTRRAPLADEPAAFHDLRAS